MNHSLARSNCKRLPTKINLRRTDMKTLPFRFAAVTFTLIFAVSISYSQGSYKQPPKEIMEC